MGKSHGDYSSSPRYQLRHQVEPWRTPQLEPDEQPWWANLQVPKEQRTIEPAWWGPQPEGDEQPWWGQLPQNQPPNIQQFPKNPGLNGVESSNTPKTELNYQSQIVSGNLNDDFNSNHELFPLRKKMFSLFSKEHLTLLHWKTLTNYFA